MTTITATPPATDENDRLSLWLALQASTDLVATFSPAEDRVWINPAGRTLLGAYPGPLDLGTLATRVPPWVARRVGTEVRAALEAGARALEHGEARARDLRGALEEQKLIAGDESEFGLYVRTVNGYTADDSKQEWWMFTRNGESLMTGVDATPIADGEQYEIALTTGY